MCSHKGVWGNRFIAPHILNLGAKRKTVAALRLQPLYPGKKKALRHPLNMRLGDSLFCNFLQYVDTRHLSCKADKCHGKTLLAGAAFDASTCTWSSWIRADVLTARAREAG